MSAPVGHTQKRPIAKGSRKADGRLGVVCYLDEDTFATIRARAEAQKTSFGEQIRTLIEWGLEAEDEQ
jgi:hypothetical protein